MPINIAWNIICWRKDESVSEVHAFLFLFQFYSSNFPLPFFSLLSMSMSTNHYKVDPSNSPFSVCWGCDPKIWKTSPKFSFQKHITCGKLPPCFFPKAICFFIESGKRDMSSFTERFPASNLNATQQAII